MIYTTEYSSSKWPITLASDGISLTGLWFNGQKYYAANVGTEVEEKQGLPVFRETAKWLDAYFTKKNPSPALLPLSLQGTNFRKLIWNLLLAIPYGETITYSEIAKLAADKMKISSMSSQAVGGAVGHNPLSIIVPCHRVIGSNGSLTGYAGGIEKKIILLQHEGVDLLSLTVPKKGTAL